ncbi:Pnap_2097 family protein [Agrobacterium sp. LAD9]|uniref:Pnap_2097 family protein n=1 Tax=Agrobacterium sp. LAD9 TaxID=2055153 RepID=UPI001FCE37D4|nr:Pnap_2097 family protein [Agrobacterium sp. LAD9]
MSQFALSAIVEPALIEHHRLGMAEMGYRGLSEQWLLRRAGDLHWRLIARAMGQKDAVFTCAAGEPLYAAFCATSLSFSRPELPQLGAMLTLGADLYRMGHGRLASLQRIAVGAQEIGRVVLISTFVGRLKSGSNRSIVRRAPTVLAIPPEAPFSVKRMAHWAGVVTRCAMNETFDWPDQEGIRRILPCPSVDFNAAGLLYFPSFSALAERALFEAGETAHTTASRHVVYMGNVEPGEGIKVGFRRLASGKDIVLRGEDDRFLAFIRARQY